MGHPVLDVVAWVLVALTLASFLMMMFTNAVTKEAGRRHALSQSALLLFIYGTLALIGLTLLWVAPWRMPATPTLLVRIVGTLLLVAFTIWTIQKISGYLQTYRKGAALARGDIIGYEIDNIEATGQCALIIRIKGDEDEYELDRDLYLKVRESIPQLPHYEDVIGYVKDYLPSEIPATLELYPGWTMIKSIEVEKP
ncbi:MAG: hypothetical protein Q4D87_05865 [Actinomycetaceae bacterium]|nr:hypothetical protein [Actinomycetaceae bacterium]